MHTVLNTALGQILWWLNLAHVYGSDSADLLFHIIMSELQYIIPDSSPKILSGCEKYLLNVFIYWATFTYWAAFIYSGRIYLCLFCLLMFTQTNTP